MKKSYKKPMFAAELFVLNQSIAADCGVTTIPKEQLTLNDVSTCEWDLGGDITVFIAGANCIIDGSSMGYGCYNNPTDAERVFRS